MAIAGCCRSYGNASGSAWFRPTSRRLIFRPPSSFRTLLLCFALMLLLPACEKQEQKVQAAPPEVAVTEVVQQNVPTYTEWVAQLNGNVNADITPKVQGYLLKRFYQEGYFVKKGQLLFEIDNRPFVAALDQEKAQVERAKADLAKATADQRDALRQQVKDLSEKAATELEAALRATLLMGSLRRV